MKMKSMLVLALFAATAAAGCAADAAEEQVPESSCEGASSGLGELSCMLGEPVNETGLTRDELSTPLPAQPGSEGDAAKAVREYAGGCTGIWYGCSRVTAEGWFYEVCGSSLYAFMRFDGPYGNLISHGTGFCVF